VPPTRVIDRFELEIRSTATPDAVLATETIGSAARSFTHTATGAFLYRIRSCGPTECSPYSTPALRASNVPGAELGVPTGLQRATVAPAPGATGNRISLRWDEADADWAHFQFDYRRLPRPSDRAGKSFAGKELTTREQRRLNRFARGQSQLIGKPLKLSLASFTTLLVTGEGASIGSATQPLAAVDSYEVRVRACSSVGCSAFTEATVLAVAQPQPDWDLDLSPDQLLDPPGGPAAFDLTVAPAKGGGAVDPAPIAALQSVEIRLLDADGEVGRIRYDRAGDEYALAGRRSSKRRKRQLRTNRGKAGSRQTLRSGPLALALRGSRARLSGEEMALRFVLRPRSGLRGKALRIQVAVDARGHDQRFTTAGALLVQDQR
jgi:hypothetical protein